MVAPFIPFKPYCQLFNATTAYTSACTDAKAALAPLSYGGTSDNPPEDYG